MTDPVFTNCVQKLIQSFEEIQPQAHTDYFGKNKLSILLSLVIQHVRYYNDLVQYDTSFKMVDDDLRKTMGKIRYHYFQNYDLTQYRQKLGII